MYSYITMNETGTITDVKEKVKISDNANTGCYCFRRGVDIHPFIGARGDGERADGLTIHTFTAASLAASIASSTITPYTLAPSTLTTATLLPRFPGTAIK